MADLLNNIYKIELPCITECKLSSLTC